MPRFFITKELGDTDTLRVTGDDARHISRSLRMAVGDKITLCDGEGLEYGCTLTRIRDEECLCAVETVKPSEAESPAKITVFMAYPKSDKLETIIQKAVELGAYEIVPFESSRCIKRPAKDKEAARLVRLNKIAEEAAKQSGRAICPEVLPTLSFGEVMKRAADFELPIFCYEGDGAESLKSILQGVNSKKICAVIGCEGGFSPEEAAAAKASGFRIANLGPRILRCETAPSYVFEL